MPIKWSAAKVSEAMDEVENQLSLADAFVTEAKTKAEKARSIPNLPQYIDQRLTRLICDIERIDRIKDAVASVRSTIPDGAIEAERARARNGHQQSLI